MLQDVNINNRLNLIERLLQLNFFKNLSLTEKTENAPALNAIAVNLDQTLALNNVEPVNNNLINIISDTLTIENGTIIIGTENLPLSDNVAPTVLNYVPMPGISSTIISQIHYQYTSEFLGHLKSQYSYISYLKTLNTAGKILIPQTEHINREMIILRHILNTLKEQANPIFDRIHTLFQPLLNNLTVTAEMFERVIINVFTELMPLLFEYCFFSFYFLSISFVMVSMIEIVKEFWGKNLYFKTQLPSYLNSDLGKLRYYTDRLSKSETIPQNVTLSPVYIRPSTFHAALFGSGMLALTYSLATYYVDNHPATRVARTIDGVIQSIKVTSDIVGTNFFNYKEEVVKFLNEIANFIT